ncbi:MAG: (Fe-S)-binding protein [Thermodesulfobacteriota bacterium]
MEHFDILHRCFRCGYCKLPSDYTDLNCPSYLNFRFETYSPGGRMWLLRAWLDGEIKTSPRFAEILYSCATCANCVEHCVFPKFKDDILKALIEGREKLVETGAVPPAVRDYFKSIHLYGNPYKLPEADRAKWTDGLDLESYSEQEYLLYVGCVGSYDERGQKSARAVAALLKTMGISFGILGSQERCDGNELKSMGERGLFELIAEENIRKYKELGVKKIVTLSPHSYHAFKNEYPLLGGDFEVVHYSQLAARTIRKVGFKRSELPMTVTFHDPCYLGRHNKEYEAARKILGALPGVQLKEMDRAKKDALCCGGGGGNVFTDILGAGPHSPARVRAREAAGTGAQVLAVACPGCARMLDDAVKAESLQDNLQVMDLAELVATRLAPE